MNDNNIDEFNIFATSKRVKKEEPITPKSPLDSGNKWNMPEEKISVNTSSPRTQIQESSQNTQRVERVQAAPVKSEAFEEIGNVGSELQKFRKYPTKTYDKFLNKMVTFNEEEFYLIRDLSSEISMARKRSSIPNKGALPRVTENTVIRAALKAMFSKIGGTSTDLSTLQTEEALESYFNSLLK